MQGYDEQAGHELTLCSIGGDTHACDLALVYISVGV